MRQNVKQELKPFAERLSYAVQRAGGITRVVNDLNKPRATVDRWMNAQAQPALLDIAELAAACNVSLEWLATGMDAPISETFRGSSSPTHGIVQVPILGVRAGAGVAVDNDTEEIVAHLPFPIAYLRKLHIKPEQVRAVRALGDSMEPTVPDGMLVLINTALSDLQDGRIYAIRTSDGLRLKRIQRQIDGSVMLISDNRDKYLPEVLSRDDAETIEVAGRAFWTEHLL